MAVLSLGSKIADRKVDLGGPSIDCMQERRIKKVRDTLTSPVIGINARKTADGRCVNTMVLMLPKRLARLDARSILPADIMEAVKNTEPRVLSERSNRHWKK